MANEENELMNDEAKKAREDALKNAMKQIEKDYGKGSIMRLGDASAKMNVEVIPTGILPLDIALGVGGVPRGRIIEIYGPESSGKTTVTLHMIAQAQKMGGIAAFIDAAHALDPIYAKKLGVDIDNLLVSQPDTGEQALEIAEALVRSGAIDIIVIDSVAALVPRQELEGAMGEAKIGLLARLMSQSLRKLIGTVSKANCLCIFINQIREKIGVLFGNPETTAGGNALKFYASQRIEVRKSSAIKDGDEAIANLTKCKIVKNKVAPPFRKAEFEILFGKGINKIAEIADMAVEFDIIQKSGSWFSYEGGKICQGRPKLLEFLDDNLEFVEELEKQIRERLEQQHEEVVINIDDILNNNNE